MDRLQAYLNEQKKIPIKRSRIDEILLAEGLRWRQQESWFGERVDPDFAAKRGRSSGSTPSPPRVPSSSASTRWGPPSPKSFPGQSSSGPSPGSSPTAPAGPPGGPGGRSSTGKRQRGGYVFGAFRPATGEAFTHSYPSRDGANWVDFLEHVEAWVPAEVGRVYAVLDNLVTHRTTDVLLFAPVAPAVGVRLPADVRGVPEPDRAVVEGAQVAGVEGAAVRDLGGGAAGRSRRRRGTGTGTGTRSSGAVGGDTGPTQAGGRGGPGCQVTCRMHRGQITWHRLSLVKSRRDLKEASSADLSVALFRLRKPPEVIQIGQLLTMQIRTTS